MSADSTTTLATVAISWRKTVSALAILGLNTSEYLFGFPYTCRSPLAGLGRDRPTAIAVGSLGITQINFEIAEFDCTCE
ncbi:MAG TPA: hypothetical protein VGO37_10335 [Steroidobacteraceae bacterium]|jgi:hypothetical protein|nr:hypothetical protein [Steroidobacteraceae bacterium]